MSARSKSPELKTQLKLPTLLERVTMEVFMPATAVLGSRGNTVFVRVAPSNRHDYDRLFNTASNLFGEAIFTQHGSWYHDQWLATRYIGQIKSIAYPKRPPLKRPEQYCLCFYTEATWSSVIHGLQI